jgi:hypothetical protein
MAENVAVCTQAPREFRTALDFVKETRGRELEKVSEEIKTSAVRHRQDSMSYTSEGCRPKQRIQGGKHRLSAFKTVLQGALAPPTQE